MGEAISYHQAKSAGALSRVLQREGLSEFATQPFLSSALYDVLPLPRIVMAIAEASGRDVRALTGRMGQAAVDGQMKGVYSRILGSMTPENFCSRFVQVIQHFYDFGPVTTAGTGSGAQVGRSGVPLCIAEWWSLVTAPFVVVPLTVNGARDVSVDWRVEPRGTDRGVAVGNVTWAVRWSIQP
jgi:hypothetical protein